MGASRKRSADDTTPEEADTAGGFEESGLSWREWLAATGGLEAGAPGFVGDAVTGDDSAAG